ncbi:MAG TPA: hypothetical protein VH583_18500 [Vicinamibacterales bacterium]
MIKSRALLLCLMCVAALLGASRSSAPSAAVAFERVSEPAADHGTGWSETTQMAVFGAALSYAGVRLGKRKA